MILILNSYNMRKTILFFSFMGSCLATFSQSSIYVDGSSSGSESGTLSNPYHTIQAAINSASNGDTIKVAKGTYDTVRIVNKKVFLLGGFAGNGDFSTVDTQANKTIIEWTNDKPCVFVSIASPISGSLVISGFTIRNGKRGIELEDGYPVGVLDNIIIENNIIENNGVRNASQYGGGISLEGKDITIRNNIIRNNHSGRGAAIGRTHDLINFLIADNRIENNTGYNDHAGGVSLDGTGTVTRNIFDGNIAAQDSSYGYGGAILITNYDTTKLITLSYNVYLNNHAPSHGGAVFVDEAAKVRMDNELFYNNTTKGSGSAIYIDEDWGHNPSVFYMNNCTVWGNSTDAGAALYVEKSIAHVQNCIFWNNGNDFDTANAHLTVNYTLTQQVFAGTGNISSDPLFADAANGDFHLKSKNGRYNPVTKQFVNDNENSPAIDAGNPTSDFSKEPSPNGSRVNLGCYGNTPEASKSAGGTKIEEMTQILWTMFPNPVKESLTIGHLPSGSSVNITDITGKEVYRSVVENEQIFISTAGFANGVYVVQVRNNGAVANKKLVVIK